MLRSHAARLRFELEKQGRQIGPLDTLIAGTVLASGATLVTHNVKEFSRVAGLRIEDWFQPRSGTWADGLNWNQTR